MAKLDLVIDGDIFKIDIFKLVTICKNKDKSTSRNEDGGIYREMIRHNVRYSVNIIWNRKRFGRIHKILLIN